MSKTPQRSIVLQHTSVDDDLSGRVSWTLTKSTPREPGATTAASDPPDGIRTVAITGKGVLPSQVPARPRRGRLAPADAMLGAALVRIEPGRRRRGDADLVYDGVRFSLRPTGRRRGEIRAGDVLLATLRGFRKWDKPWRLRWQRRDVPPAHRTAIHLLAARAGVGRRRPRTNSDLTVGGVVDIVNIIPS